MLKKIINKDNFKYVGFAIFGAIVAVVAKIIMSSDITFTYWWG